MGEVALADKLAKTYMYGECPVAMGGWDQLSYLPWIPFTGMSSEVFCEPQPLSPQSTATATSSGSRCNAERIPTIGELEKFTVDGDTVTIMADVTERWKELCTAFNFDPVQRTAQKIEQKCRGDPAMCCREMFQLWLKTKGASWRALIEVLESCQEVLLASQIKAYLPS